VGDQHASQTAQHEVERVGGGDALASDQDGMGVQDDRTEDLEAVLPERAPGLDDVGDHIGHPEADGGFDRAVEPDEMSRQAVPGQERSEDVRVRRRDPGTLQIVQRSRCAVAGRGEAECRSGEVEVEDRVGVGTRVEEEVLAGDTCVEGALADVHGDVAGTQVVELDPGGGIDEHELLAVAPLPVTGFGEYRDGSFRQ